jgi:hypothetical protein
MSTKDTRYKRHCPICGDTLVGTDDGVMVFECLKEQLEEIDAGEIFTPNCALCGEDCDLAKARQIVALGEPPLLKA